MEVLPQTIAQAFAKTRETGVGRIAMHVGILQRAPRGIHRRLGRREPRDGLPQAQHVVASLAQGRRLLV
jgi:hypothetical protein